MKTVNVTNLFTLRAFNNLLTLVVILLALYIAALPFAPKLAWWAQHEAPLISEKAETIVPANNPTPTENTLVIPKLSMEQLVHEGSSASALKNGIWHRPQTSSPDKASNTVLAGHRFTYSGQSVFYNLDKLERGDQIVLYWDGKRYDYSVTDSLVVPPTQVAIEDPTSEALLTLYTCTPLWSAKDRLVIQAKLVEAL